MATNYDSYMNQITQNRQDIGQRIAGAPQFETDLRTQVYGKEGAVPSLRADIGNKITGLYAADRRMADTYANPASDMFMKDPYQRAATIGDQQKMQVGEITGLQNLLGQRQDQLGSAIEKGMKIYQAGIDAAKFEQESLFAQLDASMKIDAAKRAGSGSSAAKVKVTDLIRRLGYAPTPDASGKIVYNQEQTPWQWSEAAGKMLPVQYPGLPANDPAAFDWLLQNEAADYAAGANYVGQMGGSNYGTQSTNLTSAQQINAQTSASLSTAVNTISSITPELVKEKRMTLADVLLIANEIDPNLARDAQSWARIKEVAASRGIYY